MIIKVEGKQHRKGISNKTGNSYDFIVVHCLCTLPYVEGKAAVQKNLSTSVIDYDKILVGQYYDFQTDFSGNVTCVIPAKP